MGRYKIVLYSDNILVRNYIFLKNYVTLEGAVSHNVLYYQQLSIVRYQVIFHANNQGWDFSVFCLNSDFLYRPGEKNQTIYLFPQIKKILLIGLLL